MESLLVKIFATALALSQVTTAPDAVKTTFDRERDQQQVAQLLRAGCTHMRKAFDIEDINLDELIATAMDDPQAIAGERLPITPVAIDVDDAGSVTRGVGEVVARTGRIDALVNNAGIGGGGPIEDVPVD